MMRLWQVKDGLSIVALIAANLIPLGGVLFAGWDVGTLVVLYWAENLIVGFYTIPRMALAMAPIDPNIPNAVTQASKLFLIPFFCVHYGGFCAGHATIIFVLFKLGGAPGSFDLGRLWSRLPAGMVWPLAALMVSHGVSFVQNYIIGKEYLTADLPRQMMRPYPRMVVLHVAIIAGGFLITVFRSPVGLLVVLVALKIVLDLYLHVRSHRERGEVGSAAPAVDEPAE